MAKYIQAAELVRYNANNRGNSVGDCVKRAISFAFDKSYVKVAQDLNAYLNDNPKLKTAGYSWHNTMIYENIIKEYGGSDKIKIDPRVTLNEFADTHPEGIYLVHTSDSSNSSTRSNHIVCVWNGTVYDSWDSRPKYASSYYIVEGVQHSEITDIKSSFEDLATKAHELLYIEGQKLIDKYKWKDPYLYVDDEFVIKGYTFTMEVKLRCYFATGKKVFTFPIAYVFTPTTTLEQAEKIVKDTSKVRIYDRFYAVNQKYQESFDEQEARDSVGSSGNQLVDTTFMWGAEEKFYNSLPGWVKGRLRRIRVEQPGQYSDSYSLSIYPISYHISPSGNNDNLNDYLDHYGCIRFEGYTAAQVKDMLNRYKTKGEIPDRDYLTYEEY